MTSLLFSIAILAALLVMGNAWRKTWIKRRHREHFLAHEPGYSPDQPLHIHSFDEIDAFVNKARCPCGARLEATGESSRDGCRVVRCECVDCEEACFLFFDLQELHH